MAISLAHPLPGAAATGSFRWRPAFTENGVHVPAMLHNGQDYGAPTGTPIRAAHPGRVIWSGWDPVGGGWGIQLQHDDGWSTLYFHMSHRSTDVTIGQRVTTGQTIGRVGMSGLATGPHLHFMLRLPGGDVDPLPYIRSTPKEVPDMTPEQDRMLKSVHKMLIANAAATAKKEIEDEPMKAICLKQGNDYKVLIFSPVSGFASEYTTTNHDYNKKMTALGTGNFVYVTEPHYNAIKADLAAIRPSV